MIEKFSNIDTKPTNLEVSNNKLDTSKPLDLSRPDEVGDVSDNSKLDTSREQDYSNDAERKETLEQLKRAYLNDIISKSECPETIDVKKAMEADFRKCTPEENSQKRVDFKKMRFDLISQWEEKFGKEWPKQKDDFYGETGNLIRRAGDRFDAHHIQPLEMGGKNEVDNITPLNAELHFDARGVHKKGSPFSDLKKFIGLKQE